VADSIRLESVKYQAHLTGNEKDMACWWHHLFPMECIHREGIVNAGGSLELGNSTSQLSVVIPHNKT